MPISAALGSSALLPAGLGFRNKIINGDMRINQRGSGVLTGSGSAQLPVDQWKVWNGTGTVTFQQSTTAPPGFTNSLLATVTSTGSYGVGGYTQVQNKIEGFNCQDLAFGTASAKPVTLSFWCRASVTGTYPVQLRNSATDRSYVALFTVNTANTWEYKTLSIQGDTTGTWLTNNGVGLDVLFNLGVGTTYDTSTPGTWVAGDKGATSGCVDFAANSGATFYLTGVQLEQNYQPTPFEQRPYGIELALCQRYYYRVNGPSSAIYTSAGTTGVVGGPTAANRCGIVLPVPMRRTIVTGDFSYSSIAVYDQSVIPAVTSLAGINHLDGTHLTIDYAASAGGLTAGRAVVPLLYNVGSFYAINVEL